jgi:hypothetical protein
MRAKIIELNMPIRNATQRGNPKDITGTATLYAPIARNPA